MMARRRPLLLKALLGPAAAAAYLMAYAHLSPQRQAPLYDGLAPPPPYRYMRPPPGATKDRPEGGSGGVALTASGSEESSAVTDDGQASLIFPADSVAPRSGESAVTATVVPLDPRHLPAPPKGMRFEGNPYRVQARYAASAAPVSLSKPASLALRYPARATQLLQLKGQRWIVIPSHDVTGLMTLVADVNELGTFACAAPGASPGPGMLGRAWPWALGLAALAAAGWALSRQGRRRGVEAGA